MLGLFLFFSCSEPQMVLLSAKNDVYLQVVDIKQENDALIDYTSTVNCTVQNTQEFSVEGNIRVDLKVNGEKISKTESLNIPAQNKLSVTKIFKEAELGGGNVPFCIISKNIVKVSCEVKNSGDRGAANLSMILRGENEHTETKEITLDSEEGKTYTHIFTDVASDSNGDFYFHCSLY